MKIAFFSDLFLPQINGPANYMVDNATNLSKRGHTVVVFVPKLRINDQLNQTHFPFKVVYLSSFPTFFYPDIRITFFQFQKIKDIVKKMNIDIIHINDIWTIGIDGMHVAETLEIPFVITYHGFYLDDDMIRTIRSGRIISHFKKPLMRLIIHLHNRSDMVICPSVAAQKDLLIHGMTKPTAILANGIDLTQIIPKSQCDISKIKHRFKIHPEGKVGIFVGRLARDKSIDVLIRAWRKVVTTMPSSQLLIVGGGPTEKELKKLAIGLHLEKNVIFTGRIDRVQLLRTGIYYVANIFVTASKIENQSIAMIEALAHGLPIIAVDARGAGELIHGNGLLAPADNSDALADGILEVLRDEKKEKNFSDESRKFSKQFNINETASQLENLYYSLARKAVS